MIEKILGVVCVISAAVIYDVERITNLPDTQPSIPGSLFFLGAVFLLAGYGSGLVKWWGEVTSEDIGK